MVLVDIRGTPRYFDGYTLEVLKTAKMLQKNNFDFFSLCSGLEGVGKSMFEAQKCAFMDEKFGLDSGLCFTGKEFIDRVYNAPDESAVLLDEGWATVASVKRLARFQIELIEALTKCRAKKLYMSIISPTFFDINKRIALYRVNCCFYVYAKESNDPKTGELKVERGQWRYYDRPTLRFLYLQGRKTDNIHAVNATKFGGFTNWLPFDEEEYKRRKAAIAFETEDQDGAKIDAKRVAQECYGQVMKYLTEGNYLKNGWSAYLAKRLNVSVRSLRYYKENASYAVDVPPLWVGESASHPGLTPSKGQQSDDSLLLSDEGEET